MGGKRISLDKAYLAYRRGSMFGHPLDDKEYIIIDRLITYVKEEIYKSEHKNKLFEKWTKHLENLKQMKEYELRAGELDKRITKKSNEQFLRDIEEKIIEDSSLWDALPSKVRKDRPDDWESAVQSIKRYIRTGECGICRAKKTLSEVIIEHLHADGDRGPTREVACKGCNALERELKKRFTKLLETLQKRSITPTYKQALAAFNTEIKDVMEIIDADDQCKTEARRNIMSMVTDTYKSEFLKDLRGKNNPYNLMELDYGPYGDLIQPMTFYRNEISS